MGIHMGSIFNMFNNNHLAISKHVKEKNDSSAPGFTCPIPIDIQRFRTIWQPYAHENGSKVNDLLFISANHLPDQMERSLWYSSSDDISVIVMIVDDSHIVVDS